MNMLLTNQSTGKSETLSDFMRAYHKHFRLKSNAVYNSSAKNLPYINILTHWCGLKCFRPRNFSGLGYVTKCLLMISWSRDIYQPITGIPIVNNANGFSLFIHVTLSQFLDFLFIFFDIL